MSDMCNSANRHSIVSNGQSFEIVEWFYLGDTIGIKGVGGGGWGVFDSVTTRIRSGWCNLKDLGPLLASRGLHLGPKRILYSACVRSIMLYGSETCHLRKKK